MPASKGNPAPIPPERLRAWWRAADRLGSRADGLRLMLLTGCRPGEIFGSAHAPGLLVRDVDLAGGRMTLPDTKNRTDHIVMLSTQALAIVTANCKGKKPDGQGVRCAGPGQDAGRDQRGAAGTWHAAQTAAYLRQRSRGG